MPTRCWGRYLLALLVVHLQVYDDLIPPTSYHYIKPTDRCCLSAELIILIINNAFDSPPVAHAQNSLFRDVPCPRDGSVSCQAHTGASLRLFSNRYAGIFLISITTHSPSPLSASVNYPRSLPLRVASGAPTNCSTTS